MITIRKSNERGHANHGWLDTYHSFSFANYYDPQHMNFSCLRVINDDRIAPGAGFATHQHRDMEIITYMLEGELAHKDSMGNGSIIRPGEVQRMSAGAGVSHSEYNPSQINHAHLLQIWIIPERGGLPASYEQRRFDPQEMRGQLRLIVSPDGEADSIKLHQDVRLYGGQFYGDEAASHQFQKGRRGYVQVAQGSLAVNGTTLHTGDGAQLIDEEEVRLSDGNNAEILLFDLP